MKFKARVLAFIPLALLILFWRPAYALLVNAFYDFVQIGAPANPPSGQSRLYVNSTSHQLACLNSDGSSCSPSGTGGFIQTLTAPVAGSFAAFNFNTGAGVVTTQTNISTPVTAITLQQHDPGATNNIAAVIKNKLAATFTISLAFSVAGPAGGDAIPGLYLLDSSAGPNLIAWSFGQGGGFNERASVYTNPTTFSGDIFGPAAVSTNQGPLIWVRIQETASNRIYSKSSDGQTWNQVFTEANTAHFTTTRYGFGVACRACSSTLPDAAITLYSFTETNP